MPPARGGGRPPGPPPPRFNEDARIRVRRQGDGVTFELTDAPSPGDSVVPGEGFELLVAEGLDGTVDAGEHGALTLVPTKP